MIGNYKVNQSYTPAEKFFAERFLELVYNKTLDSHRVKLNNPKWALFEVKLVLKDWHSKKIKNFERTVRPVVLEAIQFIKDDTTLLFSQVDKKYYHALLGTASDKEYLKLYHATNLILESNKDYLSRLFAIIYQEISTVNRLTKFDVLKLHELNNLCEILATELINFGFSKGYLYAVTTRLFKYGGKSFGEAFAFFKNLGEREQEDFVIVFRLQKTDGKNKDIKLKSKLELSDEEITEFANINKKSAEFFSKDANVYYYLAIRSKGWDYLSVIEKAKKELFTTMDLLHLGYPDAPFDFHKRCLVIDLRRKELANIQSVTYTPDGHYKNNQELYELLQEKISRLASKKELQRESFQKIVSAFRHLRLGRDVDELEQKFINYWIGLEYIFSNYDINDNTINRLKEYFVHAHANVYIKRNLTEFCQDIIRLKLEESIPNFNLNLNFLKDISSYDFIISIYSEKYPLLAFRAQCYRNFITDPKFLIGSILKHRTNLERHLTRCYRLRNEIVHDAAIHLNIESITGNLKYYLTFILTALIYYLDDTPVDINMNEQLSIEDYFLLQEIRYASLDSAGLKIELLLEKESVTEIFS